MKKIIIMIIAATLFIAAAVTLTSCKKWDNPYEAFDKEGDAISIRYLANGGRFAQEETAVLYDVYQLSTVKEKDGKKEISIIPPEDDRRSLAGGKSNKDFIVHADPNLYKLAGWGIVEMDKDGNPVLNSDGSYKITGQWDFSKNVISIDSNKSYSSTTPILTLAAIWAPYYSFEFYIQNEAGEWINIPNSTQGNINTLLFPVWKDGKLDMKNYPTISGKTFSRAYEDSEMTKPISGNITPEVSESGETVMKIYTTWQEGNWYQITAGNQIYAINDINGNYIIMNDIVVSKWRKTFHKGTFNGSILSAKAAGIEGGKDVTISGITSDDAVAADKTNKNVGMFGKIGANATIKGITFDSVTVKFEASAADVTDRYYGLLAGVIETGAVIEDVKITNSKIMFCKTLYEEDFLSTFFNDDEITTTNTVNLIAEGNISGIEFTESDITFEFEGGAPADYTITIDSNGTFTFTKKES